MPEYFFRNQKILAASMERISQNSRGEDDNTNGLKSGTTTTPTTKLWQSITNLYTPLT